MINKNMNEEIKTYRKAFFYGYHETRRWISEYRQEGVKEEDMTKQPHVQEMIDIMRETFRKHEDAINHDPDIAEAEKEALISKLNLDKRSYNDLLTGKYTGKESVARLRKILGDVYSAMML